MSGGNKLRVLDLFSGIGGFSLGLERATLEGAETDGFETVAFCEIEEFPRKVLARHWPHVPCYHDVRELTAERLAADGIAVDVICGGFPCQDISFAGKGAGLAGERSGLFYEIARLVGELAPGFVILENVGALLSRGLDAVLGTLASLGYDAEWHCIPASAVGAPHIRDRTWIIAYPQHSDANGTGPHRANLHIDAVAAELCNQQIGQSGSLGENVADTAPAVGQWSGTARAGRDGFTDCGAVLADPPSVGHAGSGLLTQWCRPETNGAREAANALAGSQLSEWSAEPNVGRVANGVPDRAHRLKALGNAVVPQIPELIGRAILQAINSAPIAPEGADRQRGVSIELPRASLATVSEPVFHAPTNATANDSCQLQVSGCADMIRLESAS